MSVEQMGAWTASLCWGAFLGLFYFGGLWLTLKTALGRRRPQYRLALGWVVRLGVVLPGFWLAMRIDLSLFFCSLIGFFMLRSVLIRVLGTGNGDRRHATDP